MPGTGATVDLAIDHTLRYLSATSAAGPESPAPSSTTRVSVFWAQRSHDSWFIVRLLGDRAGHFCLILRNLWDETAGDGTDERATRPRLVRQLAHPHD